MNPADFIRWICSILCGIAGFLLGSLDGLLLALIAFMILDYSTGLLTAKVSRTLSSKVGFVGIARKGLMLAVVSVGHILDAQVFSGDNSVCRSAVIGFYLANEGLSILENAGKLGMPLPKKLKKALEQLKNQDD
ncbi:MAG: phage holin family protein [Oscillospiraceae bacterium]|nr:phage holin family protein [Oscillospiraceae bacterium]